MSQCVSTIANDGYRIQPHIGLSIYESTNKDETGPLKRKIKGNVLNKVNNSSDEIKEVQEGFKMAFNEKQGTGYASFRNTVVPSAGKTGTAEVFKMENLELIQHISVMHPSIILNYLFNCLHKSTCSTTLVKWWRFR